MEITTLAEAKNTGLKRYFTGVPCIKGHIAQRLVSSRACCECTKLKLTEYRVNNRAALLEKKKAYAKKQRETSPEHVYSIAKKSVAKHRTTRNAEKAAWRRKNMERVLAWTRARQADKLKRTPAWLTDDDRWMIEQAYELAALRTQMFGFPWHVDHVLPLRGKNVS